MANEASKFTMADGTDVSIVDSRIGDLTTTGITGSTVAAQLKELNSKNISYIGMIIHSTTLDTMQKVIDAYGGTTWIQHSGYVLRGAGSNVVANSATKTGGNDNAIVPYHNHTFTGTSKNYTSGNNSVGHHHDITLYKPGSAGNGTGTAYNTYMSIAGNNTTSTGNQSANHTHTTTVKPEGSISYAGSNGNATNANIPNYKSVYIWERTA